MKKLIIIGARAFGREVYNLSTQSVGYGTKYTIKGFLDDHTAALDGFSPEYPPILSSVENYIIQPDDVFICAIGDTTYKRRYIEMILNKGGEFINLIHQQTSINKIGTRIGKGCIIGPYTYISNDVTIADYVTIQSHVAVGHDVTIGNYCQVNALAFLGGYVKVGECVTINPGANIAPRKQIGTDSTVGINSSVISNVKDGVTVYGNPAKIIL
jgi:sugar O-acyltransferase (sialic acid O-acetyltransferase NeuD family)